MSLKIDVTPIVSDHLQTLYNNRNQKKSWDLMLFFGIPAVITVLLFYITPIISGDLLSIIATVFTIFTALLLSLLLLLYDISEKIKLHSSKIANKLLIETKTNISFLILTSIASLFVILFLSVISVSVIKNCQFLTILEYALSIISYYLLGIFGYTILMVLKRVYKLLNEVLNLDT